MDFAILPPEINSGRMYAGPGSGPMLAAAAAWDGLATELQSAAASCGSVISGLTAGPWLGPASASMAAAAGPYVAWMSTTAAQAEQAATQAKAAAAAYEMAFAATVPPQVVAANRALLMALVASNIFGQNTPAIAATETHYAEMWAQDAAAMYGYAGLSASATTLMPFTPAPQSTNPGGLGGQAAALAQATGTSAAANTQTVLSQLTSAVPTALQGLASPLPSTSPVAGLGILQTLGLASPLSPLTAILQTLGITSPASLLEPTSAGLASSELTTSIGAWNSAAQGDEEILADTSDLGDMEDRIMGRFDKLGAVGSAGSAGLGPAGSASLGQAATVGALSVPLGWTTAAPAIRLAAVALPATSLGATPEVFAGSPGSLFSQMALASLAGRAIGGTVSPGARERIGATTRACPAPSPRSPGGPITELAEIRELTELLGKLGSLRDSGLLTDEEFNEQKQRLLGR
ncbi:MAG: PPE family protein, SVP subgroup [Mycobacterium sp.]|uniref:PPE family protein, SVP subgroup n=1 Tax=Mycobacterium sp. TaxID=1785 RepID=UPI003F9B37FD